MVAITASLRPAPAGWPVGCAAGNRTFITIFRPVIVSLIPIPVSPPTIGYQSRVVCGRKGGRRSTRISRRAIEVEGALPTPGACLWRSLVGRSSAGLRLQARAWQPWQQLPRSTPAHLPS